MMICTVLFQMCNVSVLLCWLFSEWRATTFFTNTNTSTIVMAFGYSITTL
jgi:hypothetical protein